jgi:TorA maturation chaperone TorD
MIKEAVEDVSVLESKIKIYELFANIFSVEPEVEFLKLLEEDKEVFKSYGLDPLSDIRPLSLEQQAEALAVEYARLFLAPQRLASPYESLQLDERKLWGKSTIEVNKIYKRFGFVLDEGFKDPPDHLSAQLSFLAQLTQLEGKYLSEGLIEEHKGVLEVRKYFLDKHIMKWFHKFKNDIENNSEYVYYKDITRCLDAFLDDEYRRLRDVNDLSI